MIDFEALYNAVVTNLTDECKLCGSLIRVVAGDDCHLLRCSDCGHEESGRDYLARCVGGAPIGGSRDRGSGTER